MDSQITTGLPVKKHYFVITDGSDVNLTYEGDVYSFTEVVRWYYNLIKEFRKLQVLEYYYDVRKVVYPPPPELSKYMAKKLQDERFGRRTAKNNNL